MTKYGVYINRVCKCICKNYVEAVVQFDNIKITHALDGSMIRIVAIEDNHPNRIIKTYHACNTMKI